MIADGLAAATTIKVKTQLFSQEHLQWVQNFAHLQIAEKKLNIPYLTFGADAKAHQRWRLKLNIQKN